MKKVIIIMTIALLMNAGISFAENDDKKKLAQAAQNPVANLISLPLESNFSFGMGDDNNMGYLLSIKPVIPFSITEDWNIITRTILPVIYLPEMTSGADTEFGIGDLNPTIFLSPSKPSKLIWGVGPTFTFPTATDSKLGSEKWSAGPAAVVISMNGPWVSGALINNQWSFSGESNRKDVNKLLINPFINYNMSDGWYLKSAPVITADWNADKSSDRWTVPLGGGIGKILKIGKQPVNLSLQGLYNVVKPEGAADWTIQFQVQFLFPKS